MGASKLMLEPLIIFGEELKMSELKAIWHGLFPRHLLLEDWWLKETYRFHKEMHQIRDQDMQAEVLWQIQQLQAKLSLEANSSLWQGIHLWASGKLEIGIWYLLEIKIPLHLTVEKIKVTYQLLLLKKLLL